MILRTTFTDGEIVFEDLGDKFVLNSKQRSPTKFEEISKRYPVDDCYNLNTTEFPVEIKYLHQLQNLYFALTGTEIEITL